MIIENSLVVQWLGLGTFTDWAPGSSMVRELKSSKSQGILRRKKKRFYEKQIQVKDRLIIIHFYF